MGSVPFPTEIDMTPFMYYTTFKILDIPYMVVSDYFFVDESAG